MLLFSETRRQLSNLSLPIVSSSALLLLYLAISAAWSDDSDWAKHLGYALLIACFVLGFALSSLQLPSFQTRLLTLVIAGAVVSAAASIQLHFAFPDYKPLPEPRLVAMGRLFNPVISATSYGFVVILSVAMLLRESDRVAQGLLIIAIGILLTVIALTGSRTVWLGLALGIGVALANRRPKQAHWILFGIVIASGATMAALLGMEALTRRALSHRPEIWMEFITRTIESNLMFGLGSGSASYFQLPDLLIQHPHSVFVSTFYFGGLLGLGLLLATIVTCAHRIIYSPHSAGRDLAMMTGIFGLTIGLLDGDNLLTKIDYLWWVAWFPIATCLTLSGNRTPPEHS